MAPRADVSEERRKQILDAAVKVFSESGFDKTRMDDIVTESGLSKGALYWYFDSKDAIITAILENIFEDEIYHLQALVDAPGSAADRLSQLTNSTIAEFERVAETLPITFEFYAMALRNDVVRDAIQGYFEAYLNILVPIIEQGIQSGEFRELEAFDAAVALGALMEGTVLLWVIDPDRIKIDKHLQTGVQILMAGMLR